MKQKILLFLSIVLPLSIALFLVQIYAPSEFKPLTNRLLDYPQIIPTIDIDRGIFRTIYSTKAFTPDLSLRSRQSLQAFLPQPVTIARVDDGYTPPKAPAPAPVKSTSPARTSVTKALKEEIENIISNTPPAAPAIVIQPPKPRDERDDTPAPVPQPTQTPSIQAQVYTQLNGDEQFRYGYQVKDNETYVDKANGATCKDGQGTVSGTYCAPNGERYNVAIESTQVAATEFTQKIAEKIVSLSESDLSEMASSTKDVCLVNNVEDLACRHQITGQIILTLASDALVIKNDKIAFSILNNWRENTTQNDFINLSSDDLKKKYQVDNINQLIASLDPKVQASLTSARQAQTIINSPGASLSSLTKNIQILVDLGYYQAADIPDILATVQANQLKVFTDPGAKLTTIAGCPTNHPGECRDLTWEEFLRGLGYDADKVHTILSDRQTNIKNQAKLNKFLNPAISLHEIYGCLGDACDKYDLNLYLKTIGVDEGDIKGLIQARENAVADLALINDFANPFKSTSDIALQICGGDTDCRENFVREDYLTQLHNQDYAASAKSAYQLQLFEFSKLVNDDSFKNLPAATQNTLLNANTSVQQAFAAYSFEKNAAPGTIVTPESSNQLALDFAKMIQKDPNIVNEYVVKFTDHKDLYQGLIDTTRLFALTPGQKNSVVIAQFKDSAIHATITGLSNNGKVVAWDQAAPVYKEEARKLACKQDTSLTGLCRVYAQQGDTSTTLLDEKIKNDSTQYLQQVFDAKIAIFKQLSTSFSNVATLDNPLTPSELKADAINFALQQTDTDALIYAESGKKFNYSQEDPNNLSPEAIKYANEYLDRQLVTETYKIGGGVAAGTAAFLTATAICGLLGPGAIACGVAGGITAMLATQVPLGEMTAEEYQAQRTSITEALGGNEMAGSVAQSMFSNQGALGDEGMGRSITTRDNQFALYDAINTATDGQLISQIQANPELQANLAIQGQVLNQWEVNQNRQEAWTYASIPIAGLTGALNVGIGGQIANTLASAATSKASAVALNAVADIAMFGGSTLVNRAQTIAQFNTTGGDASLLTTPTQVAWQVCIMSQDPDSTECQNKKDAVDTEIATNKDFTLNQAFWTDLTTQVFQTAYGFAKANQQFTNIYDYAKSQGIETTGRTFAAITSDLNSLASKTPPIIPAADLAHLSDPKLQADLAAGELVAGKKTLTDPQVKPQDVMDRAKVAANKLNDLAKITEFETRVELLIESNKNLIDAQQANDPAGIKIATEKIAYLESLQVPSNYEEIIASRKPILAELNPDLNQNQRIQELESQLATQQKITSETKVGIDNLAEQNKLLIIQKQLNQETVLQQLKAELSATTNDPKKIAIIQENIKRITEIPEVKISTGDTDLDTRLENIVRNHEIEMQKTAASGVVFSVNAAQIRAFLDIMSTGEVVKEFALAGGKTSVIGPLVMKAGETLYGRTGQFTAAEGQAAAAYADMVNAITTQKGVASADITDIVLVNDFQKALIIKDQILNAKHIITDVSTIASLDAMVLKGSSSPENLIIARQILAKLGSNTQVFIDEAHLNLDPNKHYIIGGAEKIPLDSWVKPANENIKNILFDLNILENGKEANLISTLIKTETIAGKKSTQFTTDIGFTKISEKLAPILGIDVSQVLDIMRNPLSAESGQLPSIKNLSPDQINNVLNHAEIIYEYGRKLGMNQESDFGPRPNTENGTLTTAILAQNGNAQPNQQLSNQVQAAVFETIASISLGKTPNLDAINLSGKSVKAIFANHIEAIRADPNSALSAGTGTIGKNYGTLTTAYRLAVTTSNEILERFIGTTGDQGRVKQSNITGIGKLDGTPGGKQGIIDLSIAKSIEIKQNTNGNQNTAEIVLGGKDIAVEVFVERAAKNTKFTKGEDHTFITKEFGKDTWQQITTRNGKIVDTITIEYKLAKLVLDNPITKNTTIVIGEGGSIGTDIQARDSVPGINIISIETGRDQLDQSSGRINRKQGGNQEINLLIIGEEAGSIVPKTKLRAMANEVQSLQNQYNTYEAISAAIDKSSTDVLIKIIYTNEEGSPLVTEARKMLIEVQNPPEKRNFSYTQDTQEPLTILDAKIKAIGAIYDEIKPGGKYSDFWNTISNDDSIMAEIKANQSTSGLGLEFAQPDGVQAIQGNEGVFGAKNMAEFNTRFHENVTPDLLPNKVISGSLPEKIIIETSSDAQGSVTTPLTTRLADSIASLIQTPQNLLAAALRTASSLINPSTYRAPDNLLPDSPVTKTPGEPIDLRNVGLITSTQNIVQNILSQLSISPADTAIPSTAAQSPTISDSIRQTITDLLKPATTPVVDSPAIGGPTFIDFGQQLANQGIKALLPAPASDVQTADEILASQQKLEADTLADQQAKEKIQQETTLFSNVRTLFRQAGTNIDLARKIIKVMGTTKINEWGNAYTTLSSLESETEFAGVNFSDTNYELGITQFFLDKITAQIQGLDDADYDRLSKYLKNKALPKANEKYKAIQQALQQSSLSPAQSAKLNLISQYQGALAKPTKPAPTINPKTGQKYTVQEQLDLALLSSRDQAVKEILAQQKTIIANQIALIISTIETELKRNNNYLQQVNRDKLFTTQLFTGKDGLQLQKYLTDNYPFDPTIRQVLTQSIQEEFNRGVEITIKAHEDNQRKKMEEAEKKKIGDVEKRILSAGQLVADRNDDYLLSDLKQIATRILDLKLTATDDEIKAAYKKLALEFHTDTNPLKRNIFEAVETSYRILIKDKSIKTRTNHDGETTVNFGQILGIHDLLGQAYRAAPDQNIWPKPHFFKSGTRDQFSLNHDQLGYYIIDLNSTVGIYLNNTKLIPGQKYYLRTGDAIDAVDIYFVNSTKNGITLFNTISKLALHYDENTGNVSYKSPPVAPSDQSPPIIRQDPQPHQSITEQSTLEAVFEAWKDDRLANPFFKIFAPKNKYALELAKIRLTLSQLQQKLSPKDFTEVQRLFVEASYKKNFFILNQWLSIHNLPSINDLILTPQTPPAPQVQTPPPPPKAQSEPSTPNSPFDTASNTVPPVETNWFTSMIKKASHRESQDAAEAGVNKAGYRMIYVADGVGGGEDQTYFSRLLGEKIYQFSESTTNSLIRASTSAQNQAYSDYLNKKVGGRSATTLTAGVIDQNNLLSFVNVGDSPAYILRNQSLIPLSDIQNPKEKKIIELMRQGHTRSVAIEKTELDYPELKNAPNVFRADDDIIPQYNYLEEQLFPGDQLFFMTDGVLHGYETDDALKQAIINSSTQSDPAEALLNDTVKNQSQRPKDDISVAYMRIPLKSCSDCSTRIPIHASAAVQAITHINQGNKEDALKTISLAEQLLKDHTYGEPLIQQTWELVFRTLRTIATKQTLDKAETDQALKLVQELAKSYAKQSPSENPTSLNMPSLVLLPEALQDLITTLPIDDTPTEGNLQPFNQAVLETEELIDSLEITEKTSTPARVNRYFNNLIQFVSQKYGDLIKRGERETSTLPPTSPKSAQQAALDALHDFTQIGRNFANWFRNLIFLPNSSSPQSESPIQRAITELGKTELMGKIFPFFNAGAKKPNNLTNKIINTNAGPILLTKMLGSGGFGTAYSGIFTQSNRQVVIKIAHNTQEAINITKLEYDFIQKIQDTLKANNKRNYAYHVITPIGEIAKNPDIPYAYVMVLT